MTDHPSLALLEAYADRQLTAAARHQLEAHLVGCRQCRDHIAQSQQLGRWLRHLSPESPAADLAFRIQTAVARQRQRSQFVWLRLRWLALACAGLGGVLIFLALPEIETSLSNALTALETNSLSISFESLLSAPGEALVSLIFTGLNWQSALAESTSLILVLGMALLTLAALGGLAQLLRQPTPRNG